MSTGDESSINAAITYAYNNGISTVLLAARTYTVRNTIYMRSGISLVGAGKYSTLIILASNIATDSSSEFYIPPSLRDPPHGTDTRMVPLIWPYGSNPSTGDYGYTASMKNAKLYNFSISGNRDNQDGVRDGRGYFNLIQVGPGSNNLEIHDVCAYDSIGDGIRIIGSKTIAAYNIYLHHNTCYNLGHDALFALRGNNIQCYNNEITSRSNSCIRYQDVINGKIYNNYLTGSTTHDSGAGMEIAAQYWNAISCEIYNNIIYETWGCGIELVSIRSGSGDANSEKVRVHHNIFYNCGNQHGTMAHTAGFSTEGINNVNVENNVFCGNQGGGVLVAKYLGTIGGAYSGMRINVKNNIFIANQLRNKSYNSKIPNSGWGIYNALSGTHYVDAGYNCFYQNVSGEMANISNYEGNFKADPQLASWSLTSGINNQDYHLKSIYGRYNPNTSAWITDSVQSPCIDRGDPSFAYGNEPQGNGNRINIGMYGNTKEASLSSGSIKPKVPIADFIGSPKLGKTPLLVSFTDLSENSPTSWAWDFGDGHTSKVQNPVILYYDVGEFNVTLKASNSAGSDTYTKDGYIKVRAEGDPDDAPEAAFTFTPIGGITPLKVQFTDKSENNPTSWLWDFGDGTTSTVQNPNHTYTLGTYSVKLTVANNGGGNSITKVDCIKVTNGSPVTNFIGVPTSGNIPLSVKFTDKSINKPTSWKWNFGDKTTSTVQNPTHTYTNAGIYSVTLTVTNAYGSDIKILNKYITAISGNPYNKNMYDNRLVSSYPNNNYSDNGYLDIGYGLDSTFRALLWFDLTDYKNIVFKSVKLCLYWYSPSTVRENDTVIEVYRPKATWDPDNVSWNNRLVDTPWDNKGGDWYDKNEEVQGAVPYDSITFPATLVATKDYYELDVTQLVNEYTNNRYQNFGFLLKAKTEDNNYIRFYSLECGSELTTPYLKLKYDEVIPIATKLTISGDGTGDINCSGNDAQIQINQAMKLVRDNPLKYSGVYLKGPFTYTISGTLNISGILEGDSTAVVKLVDNAKWNTNIPLIKEYATGLKTITLRGFTINGNRDHNTNVVSGKGYYDLVNIESCSNISIHDMKFINGHNNGIYINNCSGVNFYNNEIQLVGYDGIFIRNCSDVHTYNNKINCRINNGVHVYNTNGVTIYDNEIYSEGSGLSGIYVEKYGTHQMVNVEIYNNTIYNTMYAGILAIASSSFNTNSSAIQIHNNIVYNTGIKNTYKQSGGIITSGFNVNIENNTVDGCHSCGIGVREVNGVADITGTVYINIRSNIVVYSKKDANGVKGYGLDYDMLPGHDVRQQNNCLFGNEGPQNHNVNPSTGDTANIYVDPLFANRDNHDYHLKSIAGRWYAVQSKWMSDDVNSPCIDKGFADSECSNEPEPNGERVNIGAYGNTIYASLTGDHPIATNHAPILDELTNKVVETTKQLAFTLHATDADNDTIMYTMSPTLTGATLGLYTGEFTWTPAETQIGTYAITFTASDGYLSDSQTINIGVVKAEIVSLVSDEILVNVLREATPNTVYNILPYLSVGGRLVNNQNTRFRVLIITDLEKYNNKTITSATLSLFWYYPDGKEREYNTVLEVYRPVAWSPDSASWNNRTIATPWTSPGGDWYDKNALLNGTVPYTSITFTATAVPDNVYHNLDITDLVKSYCNGTYQNTGFLLKASVENSNWIGFYSQRMLGNVQLKISIQYTD